MTTAQSWAHPVDRLVREIARVKADSGGDDVINLTAAIVNVAREHGTALGSVPDEEISNLWTLAVCHRMALSLKQHGSALVSSAMATSSTIRAPSARLIVS